MANNHQAASIERAQDLFVEVQPKNKIHGPMDITKVASCVEGSMQLEDANDTLTAILSRLLTLDGKVTTIRDNSSSMLALLRSIDSKIT